MKNKEKVYYSRLLINNQIDLQIQFSGYEACSPTKEVQGPLYSKLFCMHYVLSGYGYFICNNKKHIVRKNEMFIIQPTDLVEYYPDKKKPWKYTFINFNGAQATEIIKRIGISSNNPIIKFEQNNNIRPLFLKAINESKENYNVSDYISLGYLYLIIGQISKYVNSKSSLNKDNASYIEKAIDYINKNYHSPELNLKTLSKHLNLNESYLSRLFKGKMQINLSTFITKKRIDTALTMINNGETKVSYIAFSVGFSSPFYFSSVFKEYANISPSDYIKQKQKT